MMTMYLCFLAGGAVLPFLSFFLGFMDGGADTDISADINSDLDLDADMEMDLDAGPDLDTGVGTGSVLSIGLLPTSLLSISALAITFGAVGGVMTSTGKGKISTLIVALVVGYVVSVMVQTIIKTLKRLQTRSSGLNESELLLYDGKVVDTILPGQLGTVSFSTLKNVLVSYPARCSDSNIKLEAGRIVKAVEFIDGVFIVEPKNKYE